MTWRRRGITEPAQVARCGSARTLRRRDSDFAPRHPAAWFADLLAMSRRLTVVWAGVSGAGKSPVAAGVAAQLRTDGFPVEILDGDVVRQSLSAGLGFSKEGGDTKLRRIGLGRGL